MSKWIKRSLPTKQIYCKPGDHYSFRSCFNSVSFSKEKFLVWLWLVGQASTFIKIFQWKSVYCIVLWHQAWISTSSHELARVLCQYPLFTLLSFQTYIMMVYFWPMISWFFHSKNQTTFGDFFLYRLKCVVQICWLVFLFLHTFFFSFLKDLLKGRAICVIRLVVL